jgi:hypothetical protein
LLGRGAEARGSMLELLRRKPGYSCSEASGDLFFCADCELIARFVEGLRRAGVPERPVAFLGQDRGTP